jgi:circadian clock protein KaiA
MELMDDFSQQLKLEGRSNDIILDHRLALVDIIANLGEMYRRFLGDIIVPTRALNSVAKKIFTLF